MKFTLEHALIVILVLAILFILLRNLFNRLKRDKLNLKIVKEKHPDERISFQFFTNMFDR